MERPRPTSNGPVSQASQRRDCPGHARQPLQQDLSQSRLSLREEVFLFASQEDGLTRVVFAKRSHLNRAIEALIRGFVHGAAGVHVGRMSHAILDDWPSWPKASGSPRTRCATSSIPAAPSK